MLNLSKMISSLKMDLGVYGMALPFDNPDEVFKEVMELKTLPVFSQFSPYYFTLRVDLNELEVVEKTYEYTTYELPDVFGDREILFIRKKEEDYTDTVSAYGYIDSARAINSLNWGDMMMAQAEANLASLAMPATTFEFVGPNMIKIYDKASLYSNKIILQVALEHSKNLSTIPKTSYNSFYTLLSLDIKMMLYNNLKHYNDMQTAYGSINLKIDDWANAESERNELIKSWEDTYHLDVAQFIII